jgi:olefin beta-lactone synthetase
VDKTPVLCVEVEPGVSIDREALTRELLSLAVKHETTKGIKTILYHPSFPVDIRHNAKIFREKLAVWARTELRR